MRTYISSPSRASTKNLLFFPTRVPVPLAEESPRSPPHPLRVRVNAEHVPPHEADDGDASELRQLEGQGRDAGNRRHEREARRIGLLYDLEAHPAAHLEGVMRQGEQPLEESPADDLVDGVVAAHVLLEVEHLALLVE